MQNTNSGRLIILKTITVLIPFALLVVMELGLRFLDYGYNPALFVDFPKDDHFLVLNPDVSKRYFNVHENATIGNVEPFRKIKGSNTVRIFVLGESTTIGYPYLHNVSFHRWLQYRLMRTYPDVDFEIVNLSLTAVNSYTIYDFAHEITDYDPDAVLIYSGHNEYYGALGVGSSSYSGSVPWLVRAVNRLGRLRIMQLIKNSVHAAFSSAQVDTRENLMKRMAADQKIQFHSEKYKRGIIQFEVNISGALQHLDKHGIPVFLSSVFSNEKDLVPFISDSAGSNSAHYYYKQGRILMNAGDTVAARKSFKIAKDRDLLRFRAPESINSVIKKLTETYPNVTFVDSEKKIAEHSRFGIIGSETVLEHVHPNINGYALMSDVFYQALIEKFDFPSGYKSDYTFERTLKTMPITEVDSLSGEYEVMMLKEKWPFNIPMPPDPEIEKSVEEQLAGALAVKQISWGEANQKLYDHYNRMNEKRRAARVLEAFALEYRTDNQFYNRAAEVYYELNDLRESVYYWKRSFMLRENADIARRLFITLLKLDEPEEAIFYLKYADQNNSTAFSLKELVVLVERIIEIKRKFEHDQNNVALNNAIAELYLTFANKDAARKYILNVERIDPRNPEMLVLKEKMDQI